MVSSRFDQSMSIGFPVPDEHRLIERGIVARHAFEAKRTELLRMSSGQGRTLGTALDVIVVRSTSSS